MAFQSALSNDWHFTSVAGVSYLGVTTDSYTENVRKSLLRNPHGYWFGNGAIDVYAFHLIVVWISVLGQSQQMEGRDVETSRNLRPGIDR